MSSILNDDGAYDKDIFWLQELPINILDRIGSFLHGDDALAFGECCYYGVASERRFRQKIKLLNRKRVLSNFQGPGIFKHYYEDKDYFIQCLSGRKYARSVYMCFEGFNFFRFTNCRNTDSWEAFNRLYSYSCHILAYNMPLLVFFDYPLIYNYRNLNKYETKLFRICRIGVLDEARIIVSNINEFKQNLNRKFCYSCIEHCIDFSLFVLAGGAVLNGLMIKGFNTDLQDLDLFWINGRLPLFREAIERFENVAHTFIVKKEIINGNIVDFLLNIENGKHVKIQFIFGRSECNISFLLHTFDLDIVQVAFDGSKIISTAAFCQAIATRSFVCYKFTRDIRDAPSYVDRCVKYNERGFSLLCPIEFDDGFLQRPELMNTIMEIIGSNYNPIISDYLKTKTEEVFRRFCIVE